MATDKRKQPNKLVLPTRSTLARQVEDILRQGIQTRRWQDYLPSELALCDLLQVSRKTIRHALAALQNDQIIAEGRSGKRRAILARPGKRRRGVSSPDLPVYLLAPERLSDLPSRHLILIDRLRAQLAQREKRLEVVRSRALSLKRPNEILKKLIAKYPASAWVLVKSPPAVQDWFAREHIPCVIGGTPARAETIPGCDFDFAAATFHATTHLFRNGHRRIAFVLHHQVLPGDERSIHSYHKAMQQCVGDQGVILRAPEEGTSRLSAQLDRTFRKSDCPTALIISDVQTLITSYSQLSTMGLTVPRDVSIICLDDSRNMSCFVPEITRYQFDYQQQSQRLFRQLVSIMEGEAIATFECIVPELIKGGTVRRI